MKKLVYILLVTLLIFVFSSSLLCMNIENPLIKELIIVHNVSLLDHRSVCALALVNKNWNKTIKDSTPSRKAYLTFLASLSIDPIIEDKTTWHPHASAYAYTKMCVSENKEYTFTSYFLVHLKNNIAHTVRMDRRNYDHPFALINSNHRPFFDTKGNACFYEYVSSNLIECNLAINGLTHIYDCEFILPMTTDFDKCGPLKKFEKFPVLLQAFQRSAKIEIYATTTIIGPSSGTKIYDVSGIELDAEYMLNGKFPNQQIKDAITTQCKIKDNL